MEEKLYLLRREELEYDGLDSTLDYLIGAIRYSELKVEGEGHYRHGSGNMASTSGGVCSCPSLSTARTTSAVAERYKHTL